MKTDRLSEILEINERAFDPDRVSTSHQLIEKVVEIFESNPEVFRRFLRKIFDFRIRALLEIKYGVTGFGYNELTETVFKDTLVSSFKFFESEIGITFPRAILTKTSLYLQLILLLGPFIFLFIFLLVNLSSNIPIYEILKLSPLLILLFAPYLIVYFLFPRYFKPSKLPSVPTYQDLLNEIVWLNQRYFFQDNYKLAKEELERLLGT